MASKRKVAVVDQGTGEVVAEGDVEDRNPEEGDSAGDLFPDLPAFESPEDAVRKVAKQSRKVDKLERDRDSAKAALKEASAELETEQDVLRQMTRGIAQLKLFKLAQVPLVLLGLLPLWLLGCGHVTAAPQIPFETWDDLDRLPARFELHHVDDGVGIVLDVTTQQAWMVVGTTANAWDGAPSWNAVTPLGHL